MPNISKRITLGIDIGGTRIKTVAVQSPDVILDEHRIDSDAKHGPQAVREAVKRAVKYYQERGIEFMGIGMGCAGSVDPKTGVVLNSPNFADWKNVPLAQWAREDFGLPVTVANDANCAMFTEWKIGNAQGCNNAILLTFGTGIGGGLILNGKLYAGSTGSAGELGHFSIHAGGIWCPCGNRGCFERYCSASAIELAAKGIGAKEVFARREEEPFRSILQRFFDDLNIAVTSLSNIFDPDCILFGGGLAKGVMEHAEDIQAWVRKHAFPAVSQHVKILPTKFANQSGAIGAALLAHELLI